MMILRGTMKSKLGKNQELNDLLKEWVDWRGGEGDRVAVARSVWSGDGLKYHVVSAHDSIGEADEFRQRIGAEDRYRAMVSDLSEMIDGPASWELMDVVVPTNRVESKPFAVRVALTPSLGRMPEMKQVLTDWTKHVQSTGQQTGLLQQVWGASGPMFAQRLAYDSLGDADENRRSIADTAEYAELVGTLAPMMASHPAWEVMESVASAGM